MKWFTILWPILCTLSCMAGPAHAQWDKIKKFVQPSVEFLTESKERLVLFQAELKDSVVISFDKVKGADIYSKMAMRRGSNPYRVWVASKEFWDDPKRPKKKWGKFFRSDFLKIMRPLE